MDELVRPSGYRSVASLSSVQQAIRMESQEEKLHKMIVANKIAETKRTMKEKARELDREKLEKLRRERAMQADGRYSYGSRSPTSFGSVSGSISSYMNDDGVGLSSSQMGAASSGMMPSMGVTSSSRPKVTPGSSLKRGMQLSNKGRRENALLESLALEDDIPDVPSSSTAGAPASQQLQGQGTTRKPIEVSISETVSIHMHQDGSFDSMAIQGQLSIIVHEEAAAASRVAIVNNSRAGSDGIKFNYITHPKIDKLLFNKTDEMHRNILSLKDRSASFPMNTDLGLLKWRANVKDAADTVPLLVNCWPSESATETYVNVEFEAPEGFELRNVKIVIPIPSNGSDRRPPSINSVDTGDTSFDAKASSLVWEIDIIDDSNSTGSMEAVVGFSASASSFFPLNVSFGATQTICDVNVDRIAYIDQEDDDGSANGPTVPFGVQKNMIVESYTVG